MNAVASRIACSLAAGFLLSVSLVGPVAARNLSYSAGKGVKCYYVLVSSVNGVNTYKTVCKKSGV